MKRRALLSALLSGSILTAGCISFAGDQRRGEGSTVEIIPINKTAREITLEVAVYATNGSQLLDHTYSLPSGHADESQGVEDRVDHLVVSLAEGEQVSHEYDPDADICSRDAEDVQIIVESDGLRFAYTC